MSVRGAEEVEQDWGVDLGNHPVTRTVVLVTPPTTGPGAFARQLIAACQSRMGVVYADLSNRVAHIQSMITTTPEQALCKSLRKDPFSTADNRDAVYTEALEALEAELPGAGSDLLKLQRLKVFIRVLNQYATTSSLEPSALNLRMYPYRAAFITYIDTLSVSPEQSKIATDLVHGKSQRHAPLALMSLFFCFLLVS